MAGPGYSFVAYPGADFAFASGYPGPPPSSMPHAHMDLSNGGPLPYAHFPPTMPFAHMGYSHSHVQGAAPPSPVFSQPSHASQQNAPPSPDRASYSTEVKVMRQLCTAMTKLQNTMKDLAERQEQILDRMSLLEQRGRFFPVRVAGWKNMG